MSFWNSLRIASSALSAQRLRLDIISNNIANAETTRTAEGGPYQRQDVVFSPQGANPLMPTFLNVLRSFRGGNGSLPVQGVSGVRVNEIVTDNSPGPRVYDPSHPDADADGYVNYPNVNLVVEMTNMLSATRSYEAGLAVVDASKRMAQKALEIGR
ncbi:MAG: flagellar basal body rod protein FlgC [Anaerolineales bacterium]